MTDQVGQVRVAEDSRGRRTTYEELEIGRDLGSADFLITQEQVDQTCERMRFHHPYFEVDSPFGGTVVPVGMTYGLTRNLFSRTYSVRGLFYKWAFEMFAPVRTDVTYTVTARLSDKWIKNDREFVAYEGICHDQDGQQVFTTRRSHVLDFIKRTAPKVAKETTLASSDERTDEGRETRQPYWDPNWNVPTAAGTGRFDVTPIATASTPVGTAMPSVSAYYSPQEIERRSRTSWARPVNDLHVDYEAARKEGLPAPAVGAPHVMELLQHSSLQFFGAGWVARGRANLTTVRPTFPGDFVMSRGTVESLETLQDGSTLLTCRVTIEDQRGEVKVAGTVSGAVE